MPNEHHRCGRVAGHQLFYREAGPADAPVLVLFDPAEAVVLTAGKPAALARRRGRWTPSLSTKSRTAVLMHR
jgi:hypothetical protein